MYLKGALTHHRKGGAVRSPRVQTKLILKQTAVIFCLHFKDMYNTNNHTCKSNTALITDTIFMCANKVINPFIQAGILINITALPISFE